MLRIKKFSILVLSLLFATSFTYAASDKLATADELYQQAVIPYEQGWRKGVDLMLQAADLGSEQAQCWIAKSAVDSVWVWSDMSYKYFKMAADQNALCGLLALSVNEEGGIAIMRPKAFLVDGVSVNTYKERFDAALSLGISESNIEALKLKGFLSDNKNEECKWFEKAAKFNDADAQFRLANKIKSGCGWYVIPGSREKSVRYWTEQAANHGNPRAMEVMSSYAEKDKDIVGMLAWLERAANTGNINSIRIYSTYLMGGDEFTIPIPADMQSNKKAYAWLYVLIHQLPPETEDSAYSRSVKELSILEKKLSENEIEDAKSWANEWMKTHQVRSYFLEFGM
ncbi:tetratricopeptide repeat protein [Aeromonas enteropelogenes]|uniref:tetratricopeptide repeat protein n=1 Tax=Aeromonas enteropelogenes TaxID=29489 RepID=UPI003134DA4F